MSGYFLEVPEYGVVFEAERLRRDHNELIGELTVKCSLPGAKTVNGALLTGDFNFSSVRSRQDRAKLLATRARSEDGIDWFSLLEEFCQKVFELEREGDPAVDLRTIPRPVRDDDHYIQGLVLPRRHPSILFGDGGAGKSYISLWVAGQLVSQGERVALFDWELAGEDHRDRLERLFPIMPEIMYCRCELPLIHEVDRLRKVVEKHKITFAIYDSIVFACNGRAEDSEVAGQYFRAVRSIGIGSLHVAHVNKSEDSDKKPFGSSFWYNGARMIWNAQAAERASDDDPLTLGLFNRKSNLGRLRSPVSFRLTFTETRTRFERMDLGETPDLASKLTVRQRLIFMLKHGSMTEQDIIEELDIELKELRRTLRRNHRDFVVLAGGRVGLCERKVSS